MLVQGQVTQHIGALSPSYGTGAQTTLTLGRNGEILASEYHGKYYSLCYSGTIYFACNQANQALTSLSATYTGNLVYNPVGSGINAILLQCCIAVASAPAGISTMHHEATTSFQKTAPTTNTSLTVASSFLAQPEGASCFAYSATTLPAAPTAIRAIGGGVNATGSVSPTAFIVDDIAGGIIVAPGTYVGLGYVTTAISVIASYHWAEFPQ